MASTDKPDAVCESKGVDKVSTDGDRQNQGQYEEQVSEAQNDEEH